MSIAPGTDIHACAQIVERGDPERFAGVMAAPVAARLALFPIYAFNVEVSRAPWVTAEPMIAEMRLQWWRDALEEIAGGGTVRRHEVVTPLSEALDAETAQMLDRVVVARRADIEKAPFDDNDAVLAYLAETAGVLMAGAARALGDLDGRTAHALGTASGVAAYLQAVPDLEALAKVPLADGRPEAVQALAQAGLDRLEEARRHVGAMPAQARPALLTGMMARPVLARAVQDPRHVADGTLAPSEARTRLRRLWVGITGRW
ncbi:squalene/phytoene synthase family protein [Pseudoponticoccus marisrubri]|uniref:Phytoene synthase n=1 Tax=Pseudoponticoccus marisrubri TaxID=1685382 RepID=A0A0W7WP64_9RHOB|nr:squalene/phytoene synthase family protein [Pseudoponticoccus marisrubri]KUF12332.1 phytoene synthase [Pseudoponticoccus marisrubri]